MASYDYNIAKDILTDNDKNRLVCIWLNRAPDGQVRFFFPAGIQYISCSANDDRSTGTTRLPISAVRLSIRVTS